MESADVYIPPLCIQLDKVLEIILSHGAPARVNEDLAEKLKISVKSEVQDLGITVHNGIHVTVPFFLSETKDFLTSLQKQGALSIDMELSVLYALANHLHKKRGCNYTD